MRAALFFCFVLWAAPLPAQDAEWVRNWEAAQRERPTQLSSRSRIAPEEEPGEPLLVHGRVFQSDGTSPAAGVIVFAYHTDAKGLYSAAGASGWRLKGWAKTDVDGRFEFATIRPASYPSGRVPAHIHLTLEGEHAPRQWTDDVQFADDPLLAKRKPVADKFDQLRPVRRDGEVQHIEVNLRLKTKADF